MTEGRSQAQEKPNQMARVRTQGRSALPPNLVRVNEAAKKNKKTQFTALMHHVNLESLKRAFQGLRREASAGVDGETVSSYERNFETNLQNLLERARAGRYKAQPVRRVYIPKSDGGQRPLGLPALEDKILQSAMAEILGVIYETNFLEFSYGFRPGRNAHQALKTLKNALMTQKISWVLDADIRKFFDSVDHEWMMKLLKRRIADPRVLRLIRKWLKAGVLEGGRWRESELGAPQGSGVSPLLANVFLHYVLDIWTQWWMKTQAKGNVVIVRYADDFIMGFQYEQDARKMLPDLSERLGKVGLTLHQDKTRLMEYGRFAAERRAKRGLGKPETFNFLGFTHYWGKTYRGKFMHKWKTQSLRLSAKIKKVKLELWHRMHEPMAEQRRYLSRALQGHYNYYGIAGNSQAIMTFYQQAQRLWYRALKRRGGKKTLCWDDFAKLMERFVLPRPRIMVSQAFFAGAYG